MSWGAWYAPLIPRLRRHVSSDLLTASAYLLGAAILARARHGKFLSQFPFLYSYVAYVLASGLIILSIDRYRPEIYPTAYWFRFTISLIVQFAVLLEVSDHVFRPYPGIRRLGVVVVLSISGLFLFAYIIPSFLEPRTSSLAILDLVKRTSLTKAAIIIALLLAAQYFRLPLGKNVSGILVGFSIYLAANVANFNLAEHYGRALYGFIFSTTYRLANVLTLLVWTVALWRYEPVKVEAPVADEEHELPATPLRYRLWRFNTVLTRLLGK